MKLRGKLFGSLSLLALASLVASIVLLQQSLLISILVTGLCCLLLLGVAAVVNWLIIARLRSMRAIVDHLQRWDTSPQGLDHLKRFGTDEIGSMATEIHDLFYQVRSLADFDELTGVHNARFFRNIFLTQFKLAKRHSRSLSVVLFDLDHLKSVNDKFGHLQGDRVLKEVGAVLKTEVRSTDIAARYGGEEFVILLSETDAKGAKTVAEKLRQRIESLEIPSIREGKKPLKVTISLGISVLAEQTRSPEELLKRADEALYRAKDGGRNCVMTEFQ